MITVFSKSWFSKHNKTLCFFANSFLGQFIFGFKKMGHYTENRIVAVRPNSVVEFVGYKGLEVELKEHFFSRNEYALRLRNVFYPIWITFHVWDIITRPLPQLNLGFDTLTVYPASGENSPVDGYTKRSGVNENFATIRAGAGTTKDDTTENTFMCALQASSASGQYAQLFASWFSFDTSSLSSGATISAAVLSIYGNAGNAGLGTTNVHIAGGTIASSSVLATTDHTNRANTSFASGAISDYSSYVRYNDYTLNSDGKSYIKKTGISTFTMQLAWDLNNNFTGSWSSGQYTYAYGKYADSASDKPKLVVTYTVASNTGNFFMLF